jgi:hypothetical protein
LGTPLERMHWENLIAWAGKLEDWPAVGALGASVLQAFCAAFEFPFVPVWHRQPLFSPDFFVAAIASSDGPPPAHLVLRRAVPRLWLFKLATATGSSSPPRGDARAVLNG